MPGSVTTIAEIEAALTRLAELQGEAQRRIGTVSPWMRSLDFVGGRTEEHVLNCSMNKARDAAWRVAETYAALDAPGRARETDALDGRVAHFARVIREPGRLITLALLPARLREGQNVGHAIVALPGNPPDA